MTFNGHWAQCVSSLISTYLAQFFDGLIWRTEVGRYIFCEVSYKRSCQFNEACTYIRTESETQTYIAMASEIYRRPIFISQFSQPSNCFHSSKISKWLANLQPQFIPFSGTLKISNYLVFLRIVPLQQSDEITLTHNDS